MSNIWAVDDALAAQLAPWAGYRLTGSGDSEAGCYCNHCPNSGAVQEDYSLHSEPGDAFFGITRADCPWVEFTPLEGTVQMSGDCGFNI